METVTGSEHVSGMSTCSQVGLFIVYRLGGKVDGCLYVSVYEIWLVKSSEVSA